MNHVMSMSGPSVVLVDDDLSSSRYLTVALMAQGARLVEVMDGASSSATDFGSRYGSDSNRLPDLVVVDLKASAEATPDFIAALMRLPQAAETFVVALAPDLGRETRTALLAAGASGVFQRNSGEKAYQFEAANIVSFWRRNRDNAIAQRHSEGAR